MWLRRYYIFWTVFWLGCLVYFFISDMNFSGWKKYEKNFDRNQFTISYLFPLGRTELLPSGQSLVAEPVYFTIYAPIAYDVARLNLQVVAADKATDWQIGYQIAPGFNYELLPGVLINGQNEIVVDLRRAYRENNKYRFILANKSDELIRSLIINGLTVELQRFDDFSFNNYFKNWLKGNFWL